MTTADRPTDSDQRPVTFADLRWAMDQVNKRIDDLRSDIDARTRLLIVALLASTGITVGLLSALLARGG